VGLLSRLLRRSYALNVGITRSEQINLSVPTAQAEAVRSAVEHWLEGYGIEAGVRTESEAEGKTRVFAELGEEDAAKIDLSSKEIQSELQKVLFDAVRR
jgi:hypothetical protein